MKEENLINALIANYEENIIRLILCAILEIEDGVGTNKLINFLIGSDNSYIRDKEKYGLVTYSIFRNFSKSVLKEIINEMFETGIIKKTNVNYDIYFIELTNYGFNVKDGICESGISFVNLILKNKIIEMDETAKIKFLNLKNIRKNLCKTLKKKAYEICSDKILIEIANSDFKEMEELITIKGIGPKFMNEYAKEFWINSGKQNVDFNNDIKAKYQKDKVGECYDCVVFYRGDCAGEKKICKYYSKRYELDTKNFPEYGDATAIRLGLL